MTLLLRIAATLALLIALPVQAQTITPEDIRDRVFVTVQRGVGSAAGRALSQAGARIAAETPELALLLRQRQDLLDSITQIQEGLGEAVLMQGSQAEQRVAYYNGLLEVAQARIEMIDEQLYRDFPQFQELTNPAPMTRTEVQAALKPGEVLIMTLTDWDAVYVWAVRHGKVDWHRAAIGQEALADKIKLLRSMLSVTEANRAAEALDDSFVQDVAPFDRALAHELYALLLEPLEHVFEGADHLITVPDGPLTSLPFSIFVTETPKGEDTNADDLRQTDWLIKTHALTTLPNVASLRVLRLVAPQDRRKGQAPTFRGFGDPLLGYRLAGGETAQTEGAQPVITRGIYEDIRRVADLTPLPNTAKELLTLARTMGAGPESVKLGAEATEGNVKAADLSNADVLAFATHGLLSGGLPGLEEPALVFTPPATPTADDDALLTASEAAALRLSASLIILSACDTAGSDGRPGAEGLSGLARSFIYAGARAILVSHWPVDDYAASQLTSEMLEQMYGADEESRARALQRSMIALMNDDSDPRLSHPKIWAPFVVVGEGGVY